MFSDLPKLFDRNFVTAHALPGAVFLAVVFTLLDVFSVYSLPPEAADTNPLIGTAVISVIVWVAGIVLSAFNRLIFRLLEGYGGRLNPAYYLKSWQRRRYQRLQDAIVTARKQAREAGAGSPAHARLDQLLIQRSEEFPDAKIWVLPTAFGNAVRAFEVYPRVMYGIESIDGWSRLLAVIPKDYRELLESARAQTDMWVNFWFLGGATIIIYLVLMLITRDLPLLATPFLALAFCFIAANRAKRAAIGWGKMMKAAFDVYLPDLAGKLGYTLPADDEARYRFWQDFSQAIVFRRRKPLLRLSDHAKQEDPSQPQD